MMLVALIAIILLKDIQAWTNFNKKLKLSTKMSPKMSTSSSASIVLGVNKYSHDTSCCFVDGKTGEILLTQGKERLTGKKHDGGDISCLVETGLRSIGAQLSDITHVVSNNHHFRVHPFEKRLQFSSAIHYTPREYLKSTNLLPHAKHRELSHHLAHAWSALSCAPWKKGLVVVMDGMGESYKSMIEDTIGANEDSGEYMHDLKLIRSLQNKKNALPVEFVGQPRSLAPGSGYREAETAYYFDVEQELLQPVFKRWSRERSP